MEKKIILGYLLECGHLDWMTSVKHHSRLFGFELRFRRHKKEWFISEEENLTERIEQIILGEMESARKINENSKPKIDWWGNWVKAEFPVSPMIREDIKNIVENSDFVGCVYSGPGRKDTKGFILTRATMIGEEIFKIV